MKLLARIALGALAALLATGLTAAAQKRTAPTDLLTAVDDGRCADVSPVDASRFTFACRAGPGFTLPADTPRLALLIGNADYVEPDGGDDRRVGFGPLTSSCEDAKLLARRLSSLGWHRREVVVLCNQDGRQLNDALTAFLKVAPDTEDNMRLMLLYFAGHGIQVGRSNYLIGTNAAVDWKQKAKGYINSLVSGQGYTLFEDDEAINLYSRLGRFKPRVVFPLLVVVDACRDNPMVAAARDEFKRAVGKEQAQAERLQGAVGIASQLADTAKGIEVWFATIAGRSVDDNYASSGHSHLAQVLDEKLKEGGTIARVRQEVDLQLATDSAWSIGQPQELDREGGLFEPRDGSLCFGSCSRGRAATRSSALIGADARASLIQASLIPASLQLPPPSPRPARKGRTTLATYQIPVGATPVSVDLFWCSGDGRAADRQARALSFATALDARLRADTSPINGAAVGSVSLREFTQAQNARPGYQRSKDEIYSDAASLDPAEDRLVRSTLKPSGKRLGVVSARSRSSGYVSIFFCSGAFQGERAPSVYLQVATLDFLPDASRVITLLDRRFPSLDTVRRAQVMADDLDYPLAKYPTQSIVKYSSADQRGNAQALAADLGALTGDQIRAVQIPRARRLHQIEIWIGTRAPPRPWSRLLEALDASDANRSPLITPPDPSPPA